MHCDYTHDTPVSHGPKQRPPTASRLQKESKILSVAEDQFAHWGFEGASLENIAIGVGMSRHNLLYYYTNKEMLYHRLLDAVLEEWLVHLDQLAKGEDPEQALRQYIKAKLEYSRKRPNGVRLFAQEMLAGAPHFGKTVKERVTPLLNQALARFEQWADEGKIAKINFHHLMFMLWATTQSYAEHEVQFAAMLGKPRLTEKAYAEAEALIVNMVFGALKL